LVALSREPRIHPRSQTREAAIRDAAMRLNRRRPYAKHPAPFAIRPNFSQV
jgi:hypothetical protein